MIDIDPRIWMKNAEKELGVTEFPGQPSNPRVEYYHSFTTMGTKTDDVPWCSSSLCSIMELSGIRSTKDARAISWLTWGVPTQIQYGAVMVYPHHVTLLVYQDEKFYYCMGGNQANQFKVSRFHKRRSDQKKLLGVRYPGSDDFITNIGA